MNKRGIGSRLVSILLTGVILLGGCGEKQKALITLDVFSGRANYQGKQEGWYGKIIKDKFNLELNIISPNVSGGGNLLFESRLSAGKVGDIVITTYKNIADCVDADTLMDLKPYLSRTTYLKQYMDAIETMNENMGYGDAVYFIPANMSLMSPTEPVLYGAKPELASFLPWNYYKELGCPEIKNENELLDVLKQMQINHPYTEDGKKIYAFSLFKDWDVEYMSLAANMVRSYGYIDTTDSVFTSADLSKIQRIMEDNSIYYRMLHLYFEANQRGLLDPESGVQSFDTMYAKAKERQVLYLWWAWMVANDNNETSQEHHMFIPVSSEPVVCDGFSRYGDGYGYVVDKDTKDAKRVIELLDWMASPEGMMYCAGGLENVGYTLVDGKPVYTDFSTEDWQNGFELDGQYGGGTYEDGYSKINDSLVNTKDTNPETGEPYYSENWSSSIAMEDGVVVQEWKKHFGYDTPVEYLKSRQLLDVYVQSDFIPEFTSEDIQVIREKCAALIKEYSWKMIFAETEEQFKEYWDLLKALLYQSGYEKEEAADLAIIEQLRIHREEIIKNTFAIE